MAKVKLTAGRIEAFECPNGKSQDFLWCADVPGLAVRATLGSAAKRYIFQTKVAGKTMRLTIGKVSILTIEQAKSKARALQVVVDNGDDPRRIAEEKKIANAATEQAKQVEALNKINQDYRESLTLGIVWLEYIQERRNAKEGKDNSWSDRHYNDHLKLIHKGGVQRLRSKKLTVEAPLASLANLKLKDITTEVVIEWANTEAARRPTSARLAFRLLRAFLTWCTQHKTYGFVVKNNAAKNNNARKRLGKPKVKKDVLQREQLASWFENVIQIPNLTISVYLQVLLLTGSRREELAKLKWSDIDLIWKKVVLDDKIEDERIIPLTPYVAHLLQMLPRKSDQVFYSPTAKTGRLTDPSIAHRRACSSAGIELTLHGLRRSFATLSEWVEVPSGIAAQIQGHAPQGVRENNYIVRPLDLLRMWHVKIETWILEEAGINFVPIKAGLKVVI